MPSRLRIRRVSGAIGAELRGVDLTEPLPPEVVGAIRRALLDHLVVFLPDQPLGPARFLAFARYFGEVAHYPFLAGLPEQPEVTPVVKLEHETVNFGGVWHSDTTYLERPPSGSLLLAKEVPEVGGDTLFANMYLAYETLSAGLRRVLDGLHAVNTSAKPAVSRTREPRMREGARAGAPAVHQAVHPVVRVHPETGRRALFVNRAHTVRFEGMTEIESAPLLELLFAHQVQPALYCRLAWRPGTIAFWDNRCTQHYPVNDYHGSRRVMHRLTLAGDRPCAARAVS